MPLVTATELQPHFENAIEIKSFNPTLLRSKATPTRLLAVPAVGSATLRFFVTQNGVTSELATPSGNMANYQAFSFSSVRTSEPESIGRLSVEGIRGTNSPSTFRMGHSTLCFLFFSNRQNFPLSEVITRALFRITHCRIRGEVWVRASPLFT